MDEPLVTENDVDPGARRLSFGAQAAQYARFRPSYPLEAIRWVLAEMTGPGRRVLDVGAGTGALSSALLATGLDVTAVEPDTGMRAVLTTELPGVTALAGSAEQLPLPDASVDAVFVGQAWHWFDPQAAVAEFSRVLGPGGVIGLLWNVRDDRVPWLADLSGIIGGEDTLRAAREADNVAESLRAPDSLTTVRLDSRRLHEPERGLFPHRVTHTPDSLVGLVSTFSYVRLSPRRDEVLAAVRDLTMTHPDLAGRPTFELDYVTVTYRVALDGPHLLPSG